MTTKAKRIILNASTLMILIITALIVYGSGREIMIVHSADTAYTCYGNFQWSTVNWFYALKTIFIVSLPLFPWLYWAMRKFPFRMNTFRTILAVSCGNHCFFALIYFIHKAFAATMPNHEFLSTEMPVYLMVAIGLLLLSGILNYSFAILYFIYKITRSLLSRIYPHIKKH